MEKKGRNENHDNVAILNRHSYNVKHFYTPI